MDDAAVAALQGTFSTSNALSEWSALIVAIGLLVELIVLFVFSKGMRASEKAFLVLGNVLIVAGVLGEWRYGGRAADAAAKLQTNANAKIAAANLRAAEIEKLSAWRALSDTQRQRFVEALKAHPSSVMIAWIANDPESLFFAQQLDVAFREAGWTVDGEARTYSGVLWWEIDIPDTQTPEAVDVVRSAFAIAQVSFFKISLPQPSMSWGKTPPPQDSATILVGSKRPSIFASPKPTSAQ